MWSCWACKHRQQQQPKAVSHSVINYRWQGHAQTLDQTPEATQWRPECKQLQSLVDETAAFAAGAVACRGLAGVAVGGAYIAKPRVSH
jgi:hypothetical protein